MMNFSEQIIALPPRLKRRYAILRTLLYATIIATVIVFGLRVLFPTLTFTFNFKTPSASKNNLLDPRDPLGSHRTNGKIETGGTLIADVGVIGSFARASSDITLEKASALPESLEFSLRRSYRGFLLPTGEPITSFPEASTYKIDGTYYTLTDGTLYPFVSDNAYLSRYPDDAALPETGEFLARYPVSENWLGFRIGSVISFADGVFLITSETEMRPVGSADIFLALGYRFEDVRPASEEEIGIYKRGKIFLLGAQHPDGTLFLDQDTGTYYLLWQGTKRPLTDARYRDFIMKQQTPISVSTQASEERARCTLEPSLFGRSFSCALTLALRPGNGNDYEIRIDGNNADIDINTLDVSFETEKSTRSMLTLLSQIKQRFLSRFGLGD
ncbi:MAG: hypothetical protein A2878_02865 [Candidatus Moranbacteria bacterium RIFCSPHIGHO2_01_FULL_54_31]|nr:MAG: hypothetical protein A2878_02865 [Candidatus Moranbacteria bacterium RIFCSPHIGHO2_01_FULL_54_31]